MLLQIKPLDYFNIIFLFVLLLPLSIIDIRYKIIPDSLIISGIIVNLVYILLFKNIILLLTSLLHGSLAFIILAGFWYISQQKIGLGDAKLSFLIAQALGFIEWWTILFFCCLVALLTFIVLYLLKKISLNNKIPLAPFFTIGTFIFFLLKLTGIFDKIYYIFNLI